MVQLNLLPDVKKEFLRAQKTRNLVISISILAAVVAGGLIIILGLVLGGQAIQKNVINGDIDKNYGQLKSVSELDKYVTIQNQLAHVNNLHNDEPVYSRLFSYLQKLNPADPNSASLDTVKVSDSEDGAGAEISGKVRSFPALDVYKTTMSKAQLTFQDASDNETQSEPLFQSVDVVSSSLANSANNASVMFTINVVFNPNAFTSQIKNVGVKVPSETTSGADQSAPKQVFSNGTKNQNEAGND